MEAERRVANGSHVRSSPGSWATPKPLPSGLLPVASLERELLPDAIAPWVFDISDRMQCAPDFVAVAALVALGSVIGRRIGIRPQRHNDWLEVPNQWGCVIGRPGVMKSPAVEEALKPLKRLEANAREEQAEIDRAHALAMEAYRIRKEEAGKNARGIAKSGGDVAAALDVAIPEEPKRRRFITNDSSYESLGVTLANNPNGVLVYRDELVSLLKGLDREESAAARSFYLTGWSGLSPYTFDRISRGNTHVDAACVSVLGSTQPGRLSEYIRRAVSGGAADDGLIQRFGLLVWPDQSSEWREVDRFPEAAAREAAWSTFNRLAELDPDAIGAERDTFEPLPFLHFDNEAQGLFSEWRAALEKKLRADELHPALESHLAKYRKLVPGLALLNHVADGGSGPVSAVAILAAMSLAEYLETHARRAYASGSNAEVSTAKALLTRVRRRDIEGEFTARDVRRHQWSHLSDGEQLQAGINLLCDLEYLASRKEDTGGRPRMVYSVNPLALTQ
jgi:putative DNA primase/helicase